MGEKKPFRGPLLEALRAEKAKRGNTEDLIARIDNHRVYHDPANPARTVAATAAARQSVLDGLALTRETADNVVHLGCALPFYIPTALRSYLRLLEALEIEFTIFQNECCCGFPMLEGAEGEDLRKAERAAERYAGIISADARQLGAKQIHYICPWCVALGKRFHADPSVEHRYHLDILVNRLARRSLRLAKRTEVAYYPPCYKRGRLLGGSSLFWGSYRHLLDMVENLEVVTLKPTDCCFIAAPKSIQEARDKGLTTIVNTCSVCQVRLQWAAGEGMEFKMVSDILLEALGG